MVLAVYVVLPQVKPIGETSNLLGPAPASSGRRAFRPLVPGPLRLLPCALRAIPAAPRPSAPLDRLAPAQGSLGSRQRGDGAAERPPRRKELRPCDGNGHPLAVSTAPSPSGRDQPSNQAADDHGSHPDEIARFFIARASATSFSISTTDEHVLLESKTARCAKSASLRDEPGS